MVGRCSPVLRPQTTWPGYEARKDGVAWSDILVLNRLFRDEKNVQIQVLHSGV